MAQFGQWHYTCNRAATVEAYGRATAGGSRTCDCNGCRNFVAAGLDVFPPAFIAWLESLGIDPVKDGEAYHCARRERGWHYYGGWYHFVGTLDVNGDFAPVSFGEGFTAHLCPASAPRLDTLVGLPVVQLEFLADRVPWVLSEEEPE